jgi:NhaP-type Na+/H+ or K+/H+ antiporter
MEQSILLLIVSVAALGVAAQWVGWRLRIPSILILLAIGLLIGPITGWVKPSHVLGAALSPAIGMTVAIIVFEGGLNLNLRELHTAGSGVTRLVLLALPLNWLFGALAAHYAGGLTWEVSVLVGAILVVTGPTVVMPLLRQAKLHSRAASILKWEAIVNDPIGATITLSFLSFLLLLHGQSETAPALLSLAGRAVAGCLAAGSAGLALPYALRFAFHRDLAPEYLKTPILLAGALAVYAVGESIQAETGLVGATIFGVVLANIEVTGLQELRRFKESLTVFLVSGLFILLTANIDRAAIARVSAPVLLTAGAILFIVRPLAIGLATVGSRMSIKERLLAGWIGPRGVVAAAVAGLAGEQLQSAGYPGADLVLPIVFCVIASTVVLHSLSLAPLARLLKLASDAPPGLLIIGASPWTAALARALEPLGVPTLITDPSFEALKLTKRLGLAHTRVEILSAVGERLVDLRDFEYLLAATDDDAYNALVCTRFAPELGRERVHQPPPAGQREQLQTLREWRGKYVPHATLSHARLSELIGDGFGFTLHQADGAHAAEDAEHWPVLARASNGAMRFFSPDSEVTPLEGEQVLWFEKLERPAAMRRPRRWRPAPKP